MNLDTTMELLWVNHDKLKYLAYQLGQNGFTMAHSELDREQMELGSRLLQIEAVIEAYQQDIAAVQVGGQ